MNLKSYGHIAAYRPTAGKRPQNSLQVQTLLCNTEINRHSFIANSLKNMSCCNRHEVLLDCNNGNGVLYAVCAKMLLAGSVSYWLTSCQQLKWVNWCEVAGWWESSVASWESDCEEKTSRLVWNGCQPGTQLAQLSVDKSSALVAVTRGPVWRKLKNLPW
jgi:hypothetical protein